MSQHASKCAPLTFTGPGMKAIFEAIDNRTDFKSYMQNYAVARNTPRGPRREGPFEEGFVSQSLLQLHDRLMVSQLPRLPPHLEKSADSMSAQPSQASQTSQANTNGIINASVPGTIIPAEGYNVPGIPASTGATFGVDLGVQRDGTEIPNVVEKCAEAIEAYGQS